MGPIPPPVAARHLNPFGEVIRGRISQNQAVQQPESLRTDNTPADPFNKGALVHTIRGKRERSSGDRPGWKAPPLPPQPPQPPPVTLAKPHPPDASPPFGLHAEIQTAPPRRSHFPFPFSYMPESTNLAVKNKSPPPKQTPHAEIEKAVPRPSPQLTSAHGPEPPQAQLQPHA